MTPASLLNVYRFCDYVPGMSIVTNAISLVAFAIFGLCGSANPSPDSFHAYLLKQGPGRFLGSIFLPLISNLACALYDYSHREGRVGRGGQADVQNDGEQVDINRPFSNFSSFVAYHEQLPQSSQSLSTENMRMSEAHFHTVTDGRQAIVKSTLVDGRRAIGFKVRILKEGDNQNVASNRALATFTLIERLSNQERGTADVYLVASHWIDESPPHWKEEDEEQLQIFQIFPDGIIGNSLVFGFPTKQEFFNTLSQGQTYTHGSYIISPAS